MKIISFSHLWPILPLAFLSAATFAADPAGASGASAEPEVHTGVPRLLAPRGSTSGLGWDEAMAQANRAAASGAWDAAERLCLRAIEVARTAQPADLREAKALATLGRIYSAQQKFDSAEERLQQCLAAAEKVVGPRSDDLLPPLEGLAEFYFSKRERFDLALPLCQRMQQIAAASPAVNEPDRERIENNLGAVLEKLGRYEEAEPIYLHALERAETRKADVRGNVLGLADFYRDWKHYDRAEAFAQRAIDLAEQNKSDEGRVELAVALYKLAEILRVSGKAVRADPLYARSLELTEKAAGAVSSSVVPPLTGAAQSLASEGKWKEAIDVYRRALRVAYETMDPALPQIRQIVEGYAHALKSSGQDAEARRVDAEYRWKQGMYAAGQALRGNQLAKAEELCSQTLAQARAFAAASTEVSEAETLLGQIYRAQGKLVEAERSLTQAVATCEAAAEPKSTVLIAPLEALANFYGSSPEEAKRVAPLLERILQLTENAPEHDDAEVARRARNLADALSADKENEKAAAMYARAVAHAETLKDPGELVQYLHADAEFLCSQSRFKEAEALDRRALALREKIASTAPSADTSLDLVVSLDALGSALARDGKASEAEEIYRRAISVIEQNEGIDRSELTPRLAALAASLQAQGKLDTAAEQFQRAFALAQKSLAPGEPELVALANRYAALLREMKKPEQADAVLAQAGKPPAA